MNERMNGMIAKLDIVALIGPGWFPLGMAACAAAAAGPGGWFGHRGTALALTMLIAAAMFKLILMLEDRRLRRNGGERKSLREGVNGKWPATALLLAVALWDWTLNPPVYPYVMYFSAILFLRVFRPPSWEEHMGDFCLSMILASLSLMPMFIESLDTWANQLMILGLFIMEESVRNAMPGRRGGESRPGNGAAPARS